MAVNETVASVPREADWPELMESRNGHLFLDGCDLAEIARTYGTPCWVASLRGIEHNYARFVAFLGGALSAHRVPLLDQGQPHARDRARAPGGGRTVRLHRRGGVRDRADGRRRHAPLRHQRQRQEPDDAAAGGRAGRAPDQRRLDRRGGAPERRGGAAGTVVDCVVRVQLGYDALIEHDPSYESTLKIWEGKFGDQRRERRGRSRDRLRARRARPAVLLASTTTSRSPASRATTRSRSRPATTAT